MSERRSLVEGIKSPSPPADPRREQEFVYGTSAPAKAEAIPHTATPIVAKSPISTRVRADFAAALKRASLERQLKGVEPNTLQDILEEAIEPWLKTNGYLS